MRLIHLSLFLILLMSLAYSGSIYKDKSQIINGINVTVIDNTDQCFLLSECHTDYKIKANSNIGQNLISAEFTDSKKQSKAIGNSFMFQSTKLVDKFCPENFERNITQFNNQSGQNEIITINDSRVVKCGTENVSFWESGKLNLKVNEEAIIRVYGTQNAINTGTDNILNINGNKFDEFAWWNNSWSQCYDVSQISGTNITTGNTIEFVLNSTVINSAVFDTAYASLRILHGTCLNPNVTAGVLIMYNDTIPNFVGNVRIWARANASSSSFAFYGNNSGASAIWNGDQVSPTFFDGFSGTDVNYTRFNTTFTGSYNISGTWYLNITGQRWFQTSASYLSPSLLDGKEVIIKVPFGPISGGRQCRSQMVGSVIPDENTGINTFIYAPYDGNVGRQVYNGTAGVSNNSAYNFPEYMRYRIANATANLMNMDNATYWNTNEVKKTVGGALGSGQPRNGTPISGVGFGASSGSPTECTADFILIRDWFPSQPAFSYTLVNQPIISIENYTVEGLNWTGAKLVNLSSDTIINLSAVRLNFTISSPNVITGFYLNFTASGKNSCSLGNKQDAVCYNFTNTEPLKWLQLINNTNGTTFNFQRDFTQFTLGATGNLSNLTLSYVIPNQYRPNIFRYFSAWYNFTDAIFESGANQRIHTTNMIRMFLNSSNIPKNADLYVVDTQINFTSGINIPTQPLDAYLCNSTYSTGTPTTSPNCVLVGQKNATDLINGTLFRAFFTNSTIASIGNVGNLILTTAEASPVKYYTIRTMKITSGNPSHWNYSTDSGTTWLNLGDGYDTDMAFAWYFAGNDVNTTRFNFVFYFNDSNGNSTTQAGNFSFNINANQPYPPLLEILTPQDNSTIRVPFNFTWIASDPNNDNLNLTGRIFLSNGTLVQQLFTNLNQSNTQFWFNGSLASGNYKFELLAKDGVFTVNDTHNFIVQNLNVTNLTPINGNLSLSKEIQFTYELNTLNNTNTTVLLYLNNNLIQNTTYLQSQNVSLPFNTTWGNHSWYILTYVTSNQSFNFTSVLNNFTVYYVANTITSAVVNETTNVSDALEIYSPYPQDFLDAHLIVNTIHYNSSRTANATHVLFNSSYIAPLVTVNTTFNITWNVTINDSGSNISNDTIIGTQNINVYYFNNSYTTTRLYPVTLEGTIQLYNISVFQSVIGTAVNYSVDYRHLLCENYNSTNGYSNSTCPTITSYPSNNTGVFTDHRFTNYILYTNYTTYVNLNISNPSSSSSKILNISVPKSQIFYLWIQNRSLSNLTGITTPLFPLINYTVVDEATLNPIVANLSPNYYVTFNDSAVKNFSLSMANFNSSASKANFTMFPNAIFGWNISSFEQFSADGYVTRYRNIPLGVVNGGFTNVTIYLLNSSSASTVLFTVRNNGITVHNVDVYIYKFQPATNDYILVDVARITTEIYGISNIDLGGFYKLAVVNISNGATLFNQTDNSQIICTATPCIKTIDLSTTIQIGQINVISGCSGNATNNSINCSYIDNNRETISVRFWIKHFNTTICNEIIPATGGYNASFTCSNLSLYGVNLSKNISYWYVLRIASPEVLINSGIIDLTAVQQLFQDFLLPSLALITVTTFAFLYYPPFALAVAGTGLFLVSVLGIYPLPIEFTAPLMAVSLFLSWFISKGGQNG